MRTVRWSWSRLTQTARKWLAFLEIQAFLIPTKPYCSLVQFLDKKCHIILFPGAFYLLVLWNMIDQYSTSSPVRYVRLYKLSKTFTNPSYPLKYFDGCQTNLAHRFNLRDCLFSTTPSPSAIDIWATRIIDTFILFFSVKFLTPEQGLRFKTRSEYLFYHLCLQ